MNSRILIKKIFFVIFIFTINNNCYSQQVKIKVKNNNDISHYNKKVYLIAFHKNDYYKKITKLDSSSIINGILTFNIKNLNKKPYPFF